MATISDARRIQIIAQHVKLMSLLEIKMFRDTKRALNMVASIAAQEYANNSAVDMTYVLVRQIFRFNEVFKKNYKTIINVFFNNELNTLKSRYEAIETKGIDELRDLFDIYAENWINENALEQAQLLTTRTEEDIRNAIKVGQTEGLSESAISKLIRDKVGTTLSISRAMAIARTETHNAATWASMETVKGVNREFDTGYKKIWLPVEDDRTRPDHAAMVNYPAIDMDDDFVVGGSRMNRPGDPEAPAAQIVNCRCVMTYDE